MKIFEIFKLYTFSRGIIILICISKISVSLKNSSRVSRVSSLTPRIYESRISARRQKTSASVALSLSFRVSLSHSLAAAATSMTPRLISDSRKYPSQHTRTHTSQTLQKRNKSASYITRGLHRGVYIYICNTHQLTYFGDSSSLTSWCSATENPK